MRTKRCQELPHHNSLFAGSLRMIFAKIIFRSHVYAALFSLLMTFQTPVSVGAEIDEPLSSQWRKSREAGELFLKMLSGKSFGDIKSIRLSYDVHMDLQASVKTKMVTTLEMIKEGKDYLSIFSLEEPVGKDVWSRFALFIYGKHTAEYKEMMQAVETRIHEQFRLQKEKFVTEEFREILSDVKAYENQTGIRVYFDYKENLVKFWEDQTKKTFIKSIPYSNQYGPLTAFFNYLLFEPTKVELSIINAMKQVEDVDPSGEPLPDKKIVNFQFESQVVRLQHNNTGRYPEYDSAIYLEGKNYLDIIYGKNIFFELSQTTTGRAKVPYAIHLDGIISKSRKRKLELRLKQLMDNPEASQEFDREFEEEVLAAKNVKVYLTAADVQFD
jgi:hypothetical protein